MPVCARVQVARYYEVEEPIYQDFDDGEGGTKTEIVGYRQRWEKDVREYVDNVQFTLVTGSAGPGWAEGQMLALPDGYARKGSATLD